MKLFLLTSTALILASSVSLAQVSYVEGGMSVNSITATNQGISLNAPGLYLGAGLSYKYLEVGATMRQNDYQYSSSYYQTNSIGLHLGGNYSIGPLELGAQLGTIYRATSIQQTVPNQQIVGNSLSPIDLFVSPVIRIKPMAKLSGMSITAGYNLGLLNLDPNDAVLGQKYNARSWTFGVRIPLTAPVDKAPKKS
jgi:hypothetical protein